MKTVLLSFALGAGLLGFASNSHAVEYLKVCTSINGVSLPLGFYYVPGTDRCTNPTTGETLEALAISDTTTFLWRSMLPYPEGKWVTDPGQACGQGTLVKVGDFKSTDFIPDGFLKLRTPPFSLQLKSTQLITEVVMSGGFYDPRQPGRSGVGASTSGMCLRSIDPTVFETQQSGPPVNPPYGDGGLPIGCIANGRIVNMPAGYAVPATAAYPNSDVYFVNGDNKPPIAGPYLYGKKLVVTTDMGPYSPAFLTYCNPNLGGCAGGAYDSTTQTFAPLGPGQQPLAGTLSVWACVEGGSDSQGHNEPGNGH